MIKEICCMLENEFMDDMAHSVEIDLASAQQDEGYFISNTIEDPTLIANYDGQNGVNLELIYQAPDISLHIMKIETILEKSSSFILPYILSHSYTVEIRKDSSLAICLKAKVAENYTFIQAMKMLVIELLTMLTLY